MKIKYKASMTIELSLLMPFIIGVFLFLFFTMYYYHDVVAINKGICTALLRGGLEQNEGMIISDMTEASSSVRLLGKWVMIGNRDYDAEMIIIEYDGTMEADEGLLRKLIRGDYTYKTSRTNKRIDEVTYIRKIRR